MEIGEQQATGSGSKVSTHLAIESWAVVVVAAAEDGNNLLHEGIIRIFSQRTNSLTLTWMRTRDRHSSFY